MHAEATGSSEYSGCKLKRVIEDSKCSDNKIRIAADSSASWSLELS